MNIFFFHRSTTKKSYKNIFKEKKKVSGKRKSRVARSGSLQLVEAHALLRS